MEPRIIFHKTGEITLQVPGFSRVYNDAKLCAKDIAEYLENEDSSGMVGNNFGALFEPTREEIQTMQYVITSLADMVEVIHFCEDIDSSWPNVTALYRALE